MNKKNKQLKSALSHSEPIVYRHDGNRCLSGEEILSRAQHYAVKIGVSTLNNVSSLMASPLPIYSARRPASRGHYLFGGALNSLGKGSTDLQAKISCLMEAIEYDCMEKIPSDLVRASFHFLSQAHLTADPALFFRLIENVFPSPDEPIMWTRAFCPRLDSEIFIPAELVFFPFESENYKTQHYFNPSTNGVASGASYLEAIIHALYEIIERAFIGQKELKLGYRTPINGQDFLGDTPFFQETKERFKIEFYLLESFTLSNIPVVECVASYDDKLVVGHGCAFSFNTAIQRAYAEALQSLSVYATGEREDLMMSPKGYRQKHYPYSMKEMILHTEDYLSQEIFTLDKKLSRDDLLAKFHSLEDPFHSLNEEYERLCQYLQESGHGDFYIVNLSPEEEGLAVVKVISPSLMAKVNFYHLSHYKELRFTRMASFQYRTINDI